MPFTDAYGIWDDLCSNFAVSSKSEELFSKDTAERELFKFNFFTDWARWDDEWAGYKSFLLCRLLYHDDSGGFKLIQESFKVYVKPDTQLILKPPLSQLKDNPWAIRRLAVKRKFFHRLDWEGHSLDKPFQVSIDTFIN
ncbi:MAG: hypothetical protein ACBR21_18075 [Microcoleus sp.]